MTLNPQVEALLGFFAQMPPVDYATVTPEALRALNKPMQMGPPPAVEKVRDLSLALPGRTIAGRFYLPEGAGKNPPLVLYFHGGGWVIGDLESHDATCRALARSSGAAVLSVDYRLAPETKFPGPLDDCYDALLWAAEHASELGVDAQRLAVAGDSAGGNLAAAVAIRARDENGPALRHQLLIYPVTDTDFDNASNAENGTGDYFLSTAMMQWFWAQYLGDYSDPHVHAAVLRHENLGGLPPATVLVAQYDPLRDEGLAYAAALEAARVPVETELAAGMIHGFFSMFEAVPDALPYIDRAGARLRQALA
ncbi:MAG: chloramphenicol hydrolase [Proteobacteria bacterium]|nr:chloramphenicol hydrolase [Pseudomonadota bacterium]